MRGYWPCPSGLASVVSWARLSLAARGLLASLCDAADGAGYVETLGDARAAVLAITGREAADVVDRALAELEASELVVVTGEAITLHLPETPADRAQRPQEAAPQAASAPSPTASTGGALRAAQRRLGALWSKAGADTPATRRAWLASPAGERALERLAATGVSADDAAALADRVAGVNRGRFGTRPAVSTTASTHGVNPVRVDAAHGVNHGVNPVSLSGSPSEREERKDKENRADSARGSINASASTRGVNLTPAAASTGAASTVEHIGTTLDLPAVLDRMSKASGGLVSLTAGSAPEVVQFRDALRGFLAGGATVDGLVEATRHLAHGHWTQKRGRTVLACLRLTAPGREGRPSILSELVAESALCPRCDEARAPKAAAAVAAPAPRYLTAEERRAVRDRMDAEEKAARAAKQAAEAAEVMHG